MEFVGSTWHYSVSELIDSVQSMADLGVRAIEIGVGSTSFLDASAIGEVEKLQRALASAGIRVHSVHAVSSPTADFSSFNDQVHEQGVEALIEAIELASVLEARFTIVHPSHSAVSMDRCKRLDRAVGVLRELVAIAEASEVVLAIKNMPPWFLCGEPDEMIRLIEAVKSSSVGVCFDTGHANLSASLHEQAVQLLPLAISCHLHDNDGTRNQKLFPGSGSIDWSRFAKLYTTHCREIEATVRGKLPEGWNWDRISDYLSKLIVK